MHQATLFDNPQPTEMPAPEAKQFNFTDFESLINEVRKIKSDDYTFNDFIHLRDYCINNKAEIMPLIQRLTIAEIKNFIYIFHVEKKERLIEKVYDAIAGSFNIDDGMISYSPFDGETYTGQLLKKYAEHTPELYQEFKDKNKAKKEAFLKAMTNPETLEEFRTFIDRKGESKLTTEQRAVYDGLRADTSKGIKQRAEERKAIVTAVEVGNIEMKIHETKHTKKNIDLFVVVLSSRVERETYTELNQKAKQLGGYYSSYRGQGAIPGFAFESREAAELFTGLKNGNVDATEIKQAAKEERTATRAEILTEKANKMVSEGEEELSRPRQANTHRRAAFAASAEGKATRIIEFGKTLLKIAVGLEAGTIKYLDKINNVKELEELESILSRCKYRYCQAKGIQTDHYQLTPEAVDFADFPHPLIYKSNSAEVMRMQHSPGKKLAAARMMKRFNGSREEFIQMDTAERLKDYETLYCNNCSVIDRYRVDRHKEYVMQIKRINRLGIDTIHELRAALRELITLKEGATLTPEQKRAQEIRELDRKFINKKIDGFFPTPKPLANSLVSLAQIKEGENILEPSAGLGHLADIITERHPDNELLCIEQYHPLFEALQLKGYDALNKDFLEVIPSQEAGICFDKIIMNPPFENLQDIDHVLHAYKFLKPGGRLVAIMAGNKDQTSRQKIVDFMEFVNENGYSIENPAQSFASAFRPTGINTITVVLDK